MKILASVFASAFLASCVTSSPQPEFEASRVVETMGDRDAPDWALADRPMYEEGNQVFFIGATAMAGNARPEACLKAVDLDARASMLRYIKDSITTSGQLNETGVVDDPAFESLTAFLSQGSVRGARVEERFWERREESNEAGERVLRLRCVAKVAVKKSELVRQLREATKGPGGNEKVREALVKAQSDFLDGLSSQQNPAH